MDNRRRSVQRRKAQWIWSEERNYLWFIICVHLFSLSNDIIALEGKKFYADGRIVEGEFKDGELNG